MDVDEAIHMGSDDGERVESEECDAALDRCERAELLRDGARAQAERFKRERDDARAELNRLRIVAEYGRALMELVEQLDRLRRQPCAYVVDAASAIAALRDEIDEAASETPGTERACREAGDVLGGALQLVLVMGDSPLRTIVLLERKLRNRLDLVEHRGLTWEQAKAELRGMEDR
jgi:hypothetical protein